MQISPGCDTVQAVTGVAGDLAEQLSVQAQLSNFPLCGVVLVQQLFSVQRDIQQARLPEDFCSVEETTVASTACAIRAEPSGCEERGGGVLTGHRWGGLA